MSVEEQSLAEANVERAKNVFEQFRPAEQSWQDGLAEDVVMEFPYGPSIGLPERIEGKEAAVPLFIGVGEKLGLKFVDVRPQAMADPEWVLVEMGGKGSHSGRPYDQRYVVKLQFRDGKLRHYKEYFNCQAVADCFGSVEALMAG